MTNKEKYKEVFGFEPETVGCIANKCRECPLGIDGGPCIGLPERIWWNSEYKGQKMDKGEGLSEKEM